MNILKFQHKELKIPACWEVFNNNFLDIEPDNKYPIDEVFYHFDEDILWADYNGYFIDLGFYGSYLNDRNGFFKIIVAKGDFQNGELYEIFISRSTGDIKEKLNYYFDAIPKGFLDKINGFKFEDDIAFIADFDIYSAVDNISKKLMEKEFDEIAMNREA